MQVINTKNSFHIIYLISFSHLINDLIQGVIPSIFPLIKESFQLSFGEIGLMTFAFQFSASILQPLVGYYTDKNPKVYAQIYGLVLTLFGVIFLSYAFSFAHLIVSCILIGIGSAIFHPESSRIANLASGGKIGVAQSIFQIGGNLGTALAPILVTILVLPNSKQYVNIFILPLIIGLFLLKKITAWYKKHLETKISHECNKHSMPSISFSKRKLKFIIGILLLLIIFSKFIYAASLSNYYSFYLIEKFNLTIEQSQTHLFLYLFSYMLGTIIGGPLGDKFGRLYVIWFSVFGATPFIVCLPYANLFYTDVLMVIIGLIMASAFPAIMSYAQELLPQKLGVISGLFYGFAFGVAAIGSALIGLLADFKSISFVYQLCSFLPLIGVVCFLLPNINSKNNTAAKNRCMLT